MRANDNNLLPKENQSVIFFKKAYDLYKNINKNELETMNFWS